MQTAKLRCHLTMTMIFLIELIHWKYFLKNKWITHQWFEGNKLRDNFLFFIKKKFSNRMQKGAFNNDITLIFYCYQITISDVSNLYLKNGKNN